ncbi:hypothetical protein BJX66DRAFT_8291 [Aspergillus keveii]|uniref:Uncharacterized protein n=1 Tax=Aspergillus keveii TaxID=714993 RepID=A0ABR4GQJ5_9EURO
MAFDPTLRASRSVSETHPLTKVDEEGAMPLVPNQQNSHFNFRLLPACASALTFGLACRNESTCRWEGDGKSKRHLETARLASSHWSQALFCCLILAFALRLSHPLRLVCIPRWIRLVH